MIAVVIYVLALMSAFGWLEAWHYRRLNRINESAFKEAMDGWQRANESLRDFALDLHPNDVSRNCKVVH